MDIVVDSDSHGLDDVVVLVPRLVHVVGRARAVARGPLGRMMIDHSLGRRHGLLFEG